MLGYFLSIWCIQLLTSLWLCGYWIHCKVSFERNNIILCSKNPTSPSQTMAITGIDYSACAGHQQPPRNHLPFYRWEKWGLGGVTYQWVHIPASGAVGSGPTFIWQWRHVLDHHAVGFLAVRLPRMAERAAALVLYFLPWLSGNPSIIAITVFYCAYNEYLLSASYWVQQ